MSRLGRRWRLVRGLVFLFVSAVRSLDGQLVQHAITTINLIRCIPLSIGKGRFQGNFSGGNVLVGK